MKWCSASCAARKRSPCTSWKMQPWQRRGLPRWTGFRRWAPDQAALQRPAQCHAPVTLRLHPFRAYSCKPYRVSEPTACDDNSAHRDGRAGGGWHMMHAVCCREWVLLDRADTGSLGRLCSGHPPCRVGPRRCRAQLRRHRARWVSHAALQSMHRALSCSCELPNTG